MKKITIRGKDLRRIGCKDDMSVSLAKQAIIQHYKHLSKVEALDKLAQIIENPDTYIKHNHFSKFAAHLLGKPTKHQQKVLESSLLPFPKPYKIYGREEIEQGTISQMDTAMQLPITVRGALMPDAHQGYGLPIGGVLATKDVIIPYGVGMDIGCRMCLSVFDIQTKILNDKGRLKKILEDHTRFGHNEFKDRKEHPIFERQEFREIRFLASLQNKAYNQLGTSGHGNHFVDMGIFSIKDTHNPFNIDPGDYFAVLSHSGSRGMGAEIARYYTKIAKDKCRLPKGATNLAWLNLSTNEGQEYWAAMNLAGDYSAANHTIIHQRLARAFGEKPIVTIENHHNFAWKEKLEDGQEVIVHRKGATPAHTDSLGIIPGSMATPAFIVQGKGNFDGINSASHGAGRLMSRGVAKQTFNNNELQQILLDKEITLMGGGIDESPGAYKDINRVMQYQNDLVNVLAKFFPKIVRMAKS